MSTAAVASASSAPVDTLPGAADVLSATIDRVSPEDDALAAHAAVLKAGKDGDKIDRDALNKLVNVIGTETADPVSRDVLLAHTLLLSIFHHQLRDGDNAFLCAAKVRYLAYLDMLAMAAIGAKVAMGVNKDNFESLRQFWAKHLPADMPYNFTPTDADETKVVGHVACLSCKSELALAMPEYAALRLHGKAHMSMLCTTTFMAEHVAVHHFLTIVMNALLTRVASTQTHPKTRQPMPKLHSNMVDVAALFNTAVWAKYVEMLPMLATWTDIKAKVMALIMKDAADSLVLPGNRRCFAMVMHVHQGVMAGLCEALVQYPKFLAMAVVHPGTPLVPTTVIDLSWHMHQLSPLDYGKQTLSLIGHIMNHDDSDDGETKALIESGTKETAELWMREFGEDYLQPRLPCVQGDKYQATKSSLFSMCFMQHDHCHVDCAAITAEHSNCAAVDADVMMTFCLFCWKCSNTNCMKDADMTTFCSFCWKCSNTNCLKDANMVLGAAACHVE
ncbi:hypothetical protein GGF32_004231 [Allomyces javanicus]|nr:hypothetical protein GGF32_004231 [Allomyces javanicus]